jgi:hypothetical protein
MQTLLFLLIVFLPPLISGPVPAALVFRVAPGLNWRHALPLTVLLAVVLNIIAFVVIVANLNGLLPPGFFACVLTPVAAIATLIVSLGRLRRTDAGPGADPMQRKWLRVSLITIPLLQVLMVSILVLIAPALCGTALRTCTNY